MEEAESLGDGVVVVSGGKIQAQGTSQDLKALYGIGFHLHVVKAAAPGGGEFKFQLEGLEEVIRRHVGGDVGGDVGGGDGGGEVGGGDVGGEKQRAKLLTDVGAECSFALPRRAQKAFPAMFSELHDRGEELGVEQVAVSQTTLEEVFLELQKKGEEEKKKMEDKGKGKGKEEEEEKEEDKDSDPSPPTRDLEAASDLLSGVTIKTSPKQQIFGMMYLIVRTYLRAPTALLYLTFNPVLMVCIAGAVYLSRGEDVLATTVVGGVGEVGLFANVNDNEATVGFPFVMGAEDFGAKGGGRYLENLTSVTDGAAQGEEVSSENTPNTHTHY